MLLLFGLSNQHFVTHFKFNFVLFRTEDDRRTVETFFLILSVVNFLKFVSYLLLSVPLFTFMAYATIYPDVSSHWTNLYFFPFT